MGNDVIFRIAAPVYRLCAYLGCEWQGMVNESPFFGTYREDNAADVEQLGHMFYSHGYPYQPWDYKAIRRTLTPPPARTSYQRMEWDGESDQPVLDPKGGWGLNPALVARGTYSEGKGREG